MIREEVKQIKVSGYSLIPQKFVGLFEVFKPAVKLMRAEVSKSPPNDWYHEGSRFWDDERVFLRIGSAINKSGIDSCEFSEEELQHLARKALLDCASADYYYTFEKEWD